MVEGNPRCLNTRLLNCTFVKFTVVTKRFILGGNGIDGNDAIVALTYGQRLTPTYGDAIVVGVQAWDQGFHTSLLMSNFSPTGQRMSSRGPS